MHSKWLDICLRHLQRSVTRTAMQGASRTLQRRKKFRRLRGLRRGGEDGLSIGLQNAQPAVEILRMIGARRVGDAKIGAKKSRAEFGDKLLHCVGVIAEALAELAIAAVFCAGPMGLMPISA